MKKLAALALSGAVISTAAFAANPPDGTITITATVVEACEWDQQTDTIQFDIDLIGTSYSGNTTGQLTFNCVKGTDGSITWTSANNGQLSNGSDTIDYNLTVNLSGSDPASNISSGHNFTDNDGSAGLETLTFTVTPDVVQAKNDNVPAGQYTDTITVSIDLNP
ncbi:spore coat protein U domain-containing protein [Lutibacter sp.]